MIWECPFRYPSLPSVPCSLLHTHAHTHAHTHTHIHTHTSLHRRMGTSGSRCTELDLEWHFGTRPIDGKAAAGIVRVVGGLKHQQIRSLKFSNQELGDEGA